MARKVAMFLKKKRRVKFVWTNREMLLKTLQVQNRWEVYSGEWTCFEIRLPNCFRKVHISKFLFLRVIKSRMEKTKKKYNWHQNFRNLSTIARQFTFMILLKVYKRENVMKCLHSVRVRRRNLSKTNVLNLLSTTRNSWAEYILLAVA